MAESIPLGDRDEEAPPLAEIPQRSHKRKTTGTPRRQSRDGQRRASAETRLREALEALADWLSERGDAELGTILHTDAPKMAAVLGRFAKLNPLAAKAVAVLADVLEPVRAFGPTLRVLWRRLLERRATQLAEREQEQELPPEELLTHTHVRGPDAAEAEAPVAEPWRLR